MHGKRVLWLICLAAPYGVTIQIFSNNVVNSIFLIEGNFNCFARIGRVINDDLRDHFIVRASRFNLLRDARSKIITI
jgi:hypothetical protein